MQAAILAPGTAAEAVASEAALAEIAMPDAGEMILPSRTLEPLERLDIYRGMYTARLREALEVDYPALAGFFGEKTFAELTALYLRHCPSRSYTLNRLGDGLPEFVQGVENLPRRGFVCELARVELAMTQVVDETETPVLEVETIAKVPGEAWPSARLQPVAALRLLALRYPVNAYLNAIWDGGPVPKLLRKNTWLAISRRNYVLIRTDMRRPAFETLSALAAGKTLGEAIGNRRISEKNIFAWFRDWAGAGVFQSVAL